MNAVCSRRKSSQDHDVQPEELRLLNLMKIILDGGWVIEEIVFQEMLDISGITNINEQYW